jgi:tRNA uridine 5-carboxymethylaminomethyl modification enzyme
MKKIREVWPQIAQNGQTIDNQVEINAHYSGYLIRQSHDIAAFKKDENILIPQDINYDSFSGLSNEIKSKLIEIRPKTLGQALRIDGVTPAAAIILLSFIKRSKFKAHA